MRPPLRFDIILFVFVITCSVSASNNFPKNNLKNSHVPLCGAAVAVAVAQLLMAALCQIQLSATSTFLAVLVSSDVCI